MFYGEYEHALDDKGRVTVPSKIREVLTGRSIASLMLTRSVLDPCLALYPPSEWERIEGEISPFVMVLEGFYDVIVLASDGQSTTLVDGLEVRFAP